MTYTKWLIDNLKFFFRKSFSIMIFTHKTFVKLLFGREFIHCKSSFFSCKEIIFLKTLSIRTIGKRNIHHHSVFLRLLHSIAYRMCIIFSFYNSNRGSLIIVKHIIGIFCFITCHKITTKVNLTIGKLNLPFHRNIIIPPSLSHYTRGYEF